MRTRTVQSLTMVDNDSDMDRQGFPPGDVRPAEKKKTPSRSNRFFNMNTFRFRGHTFVSCRLGPMRGHRFIASSYAGSYSVSVLGTKFLFLFGGTCGPHEIVVI